VVSGGNTEGTTTAYGIQPLDDYVDLLQSQIDSL
jgi:hypothetical protein